MFIVYVLECYDDIYDNYKYYVGQTKDLDVRFEQHKNGGARCSNWTREYPPIRVIWEKRTNNRGLELAITLKCMEKYGIDNVRGSIYSQMDLSNDDLNRIYNKLDYKCPCCGRYGHSAYNCRCDICGERDHLTSQCDNCSKCGGRHTGNYSNCNNCYKCQRPGHHYSNCDRCYKCGRRGHFARNHRYMK
ncbi:hypothetical protein C1645_738134 [Glomus cerebriforme]|uniref:GIY-YIG domain-containing protein n=1 Tax=Glomus cerebriforme TaxID=658196 RepID=A0A397SYI0_9GLOM|nr:hypothetical protein C1645_738134 [Glomus cerebriforme]